MIKKYLKKVEKIIRISFIMAKTDFTLRIEGSYLGIFWYLLNPLLMFLILILIQKYAIITTGTNNYPMYLLIGLTGFNFFKQALSNSIKAISSNTNYIKSINNIEPEILVISSVLQASFSHFFEFLIIIIFTIYYKISLIGLAAYPVIFFFFVVFTLGIAFIFATIGAYIEDFNNVWATVTQLLFFVTPVFYVIKKSSPTYLITLFNPIFYFLSISRNMIINIQPPSFPVALFTTLFSITSLIIGLIIFNKFKNKFSEL